MLPFEQTLKLQIWLRSATQGVCWCFHQSQAPVEEDHLHVHVLPVLVEEVLEEVGDRFVGDVAADNYVPRSWKLGLI